MLYCDHEMCLEGNQSLNITFKTWINKISKVSDFNSKDLITRKDLVHKSDREWSKDYSKLSGYCFYSSLKTFQYSTFYTAILHSYLQQDHSFKITKDNHIRDCYSVLCGYSKVYVLILLDQPHTDLIKLYVDYFLII